MKQFAVFTHDPNLESAIDFIRQHELDHEIHLNRVRFWIAEGPVLTEFLLRFETFSVVQDH